MYAITMIDGSGAMRFEIHNPVPTGTELLTTEGQAVIFDGIDSAGLLLCTHPSTGETESYFPHDIQMPSDPDAATRRNRLAVAANAIATLQEADQALHEVFFRARHDMAHAAHHVARIELACGALRDVIGNGIVSLARVEIMAAEQRRAAGG